jgi:hypothetical protein
VLAQLVAGSVVIRAAKSTLVTGPGALEQRPVHDRHTATRAKMVDKEEYFVEK